MTTATELSVTDRLAQVLDHLGIERAHFAASMLADITGFVQAHPERIASLTLVCQSAHPPFSRRCLPRPNRGAAAATETLREPTFPSIGMDRR